MGVPAAQPLPARRVGWEKSTLRDPRDGGSHRRAVFQNCKTVQW